MAELQIACLGEFQITLDGTVPTAVVTDKARALLAYLIIEGQIHERSKLAQFLWPGYTVKSARNSMRQSLYLLRQFLPDTEAAPWFLVTRQTVQLNPTAPLSVDVITFTQLLAACRPHHHTDLSRMACFVLPREVYVALFRYTRNLRTYFRFCLMFVFLDLYCAALYNKLKLISVPAGFGKTMLSSKWSNPAFS